jgi:hypothetical protein
MKKTSIYILLIVLLGIFSISGYVIGSDKALRHYGINQMLSIRLYSRLTNPQDIKKLEKVLLVGIEAADEILEDTSVNRPFPSGYYNRFM